MAEKPSFQALQRPAVGKHTSSSSHQGGHSYGAKLNGGAVVNKGGSSSNGGTQGKSQSMQSGGKDH